jgi:hypothetical protein
MHQKKKKKKKEKNNTGEITQQNIFIYKNKYKKRYWVNNFETEIIVNVEIIGVGYRVLRTSPIKKIVEISWVFVELAYHVMHVYLYIKNKNKNKIK